MFSIVGIGNDPNGFFLLDKNSFVILLACTTKEFLGHFVAAGF